MKTDSPVSRKARRETALLPTLVTKLANLDDKTETMIAATDPQEFVPSGRQHAARHPGPVADASLKPTSDSFLLDKFEKVSIRDSEHSERWFLRKSPNQTSNCWKGGQKAEDKEDLFKSCASEGSTREVSGKQKGKQVDTKLELGYMEEELYVKGNVVIWSRGLMNNSDDLNHSKVTVCSYSSPHPIKHAIWCTFYSERPSFTAEADKESAEKAMEAVCIVDNECIRIFTADSEDFIDSVPFQVRNIWTMKHGILLEKQREEDDKGIEIDTSPKLYSLAHPLETYHPVAVKESSFGLIDNFNLQIVFTSDDPSMAVIYNHQSGHHCVYHIRKLKRDEWTEPTKRSIHSNINISNKLKSRVSLWDINKPGVQSTPSPIHSRAASIGSFCTQRSYNSMAMISRCQSPASPLISGSSWLGKTGSLLSSRHHMQSVTTTHQETVVDPNSTFQPVVCLEHIWTDYISTSQDGSFVGPASKVFVCDDLTGQGYLCYLLPAKVQLSMVKMDFTHPATFIFGVFTSISAQDAIPIPHLHMLAILETSGSIVLYSGLTAVGKLHVGGVLAEHTPSPLIRRNIAQFNSPFPRRSSLLPNCGGTPASGPHFDEHLLSPVMPSDNSRKTKIIQVPFQTDLHKAFLNGLRDPIENRFTLQYSDGTYYRITLPSVASSPLVESCINVLRQTLPRDAALTLLTRWYAAHNAPGPSDRNAEMEWNKFCSIILTLLGYEDENRTESVIDSVSTPSVPPKRQKQSSSGSDSDWKMMINSDYHESVHYEFRNMLNLNIPLQTDRNHFDLTILNATLHNSNSVLFPYIHVIHFTLHLLYEELKLNTMRSKELPFLARFLSKLAGDLGLKEYMVGYWKDFPLDCLCSSAGLISANDLKRAVHWSVMSEKPYFVMQYLYNMLYNVEVLPFPHIPNVNPRTVDIIQLFALLINGPKSQSIKVDTFVRTVLPTSSKCEPFSTPKAHTITVDQSPCEKAVILMTEMNITNRILDTLPVGISLLLYDALWSCREHPPPDWPAVAYTLLWRADLAAQSQIVERDKAEGDIKKYGMYSSSQLQEILPTIKQASIDEEDGMEDVENPVLKMRFPEDLRVVETRRLLQSSKPVTISLVQRPDVSDHEFIEEQEKHLYALCTRTMALPVARGMFTLRTATPVITEPLSTPPLCLTGRASSKGTTVELTHIDTPANMNLWPLFHNGVANGLRIAPDAHNIDTTWITFNRPKGNETQMEHAGFLMALGLNGHLRNLGFLSTYNYLMKQHEMTSVGVLLGLAAAFRGTSNSRLTKGLSIHVEALRPPTSMEIDVAQNLQVASLMGLGLLYQGTAHRHITEVLLSEIGRPPGPEMENSVDRESYSLAAGLALGLVTLKQGERTAGVPDLNVADMLHYYMVGGHRRPLTGAQRDKYKVASFQIKEGSGVNLDVTAPGATLALGLMYLGTGNKAVANWMAPPDTQYLLDFVRPDFLMLRILARALIMWDEIRPTEEWIEKQVPDTIRPFCMITPSPQFDVDYEAMNQAYCNIVAGACFSVGLKYAGSKDETAFQTLLCYCHKFISLTSKSISDLAGKPTIETCLSVCLISTSMVMAGSGNLEIMRLVRHLRRRVGASSSSVVTYGSHLIIHMALGLLFLGGGRYTLSNSPAAVAALIAAFYPKFPTHSNDNRYHLQAFRHLYVLAVEARLIMPKDVILGRMCYVRVKVTFKDGSTMAIRAPGIIPDLNQLRKVEIDDERYWPVVFERQRNWEQLMKLLSTNGCVEVKQRAGCLSYTEDKLGYHSRLARTLTQSESIPWDPPSKAIISFTSESMLRNFCDNYLTCGKETASKSERKQLQILTRITYECVIKDKLVAIPIFTALLKTVRDLTFTPSTLQLWQLKLACAQVLNSKSFSNLLTSDTLLALKQEAVTILDSWEDSLNGFLKEYVAEGTLNCHKDVASKLSAYLTFYDIPFAVNVHNFDRLLQAAVNLQSKGCTYESISKVLHLSGV